jgi:hypothetical protein
MSIRIFVTLSRFIVLFIFFFLFPADFIYRRFSASDKHKEPCRLSRPTSDSPAIGVAVDDLPDRAANLYSVNAIYVPVAACFVRFSTKPFASC